MTLRVGRLMHWLSRRWWLTLPATPLTGRHAVGEQHEARLLKSVAGHGAAFSPSDYQNVFDQAPC